MKRSSDADLHTRLLAILRAAPSSDEAAQKLSAAVRDHIVPRPRSCYVDVTWSSSATKRKAWIVPNGHAAIAVEFK